MHTHFQLRRTRCRVDSCWATPTKVKIDQALQDHRDNEAVLVVEDDDLLHDVTKRILEKHDYSVLACESGPDAIALVQRHDGDVELLLSDVFMPVMLGTEVADKIHEIIPELRILYTSGYAQPVHGSTLRHDVALLEKPYSEEQLLAKVRDSIDRVR